MNNTRSLILLIVAIIAGVTASLIASRWLQTQAKSGDKIVVAAVDINLGQKLTPDMLKIVEWPSGSLPQYSFKELVELEGRVVKSSILTGEPMIEGKLAPRGSQGGLSAVISEGKRAITVRVNDVVGVAGFALPGNYVDIIVNTDKEVEGGNQVQNISKRFLEKILVLAVAQEVNRDDSKPRVVNAVTLEVEPEQAEMIDLARSVGNLSLVLRNQIDNNPNKTTGITKESLLSTDQNLTENKSNLPVTSKPTKITEKSITKPLKTASVKKTCVKVITGLTSSLECF